ncbi:unnamed protein product [Mytilus edulis]|uniref:Endonuclease/exonuclease/phosphatase domain-containing protein n=1 Tax=Mytilus edulis TaxID=6550 RepID=A0A8S3TNP5_MYTED|nr:unnamed protein product [Mytilus edulis]
MAVNSFLSRRLFLATILNKTVINQPWTINYSTANVKLAHRTRRGTKGGRKVVRSIRTLVSSSRDFIPKQKQHGVNINNLSQLAFQTSAIPTSSNQPISSIPSIIKPRIPQNKLTSVPNLLNFAKIPKAISNNNKCLSLFSLNCRSVKNKTVSLCDFIQSNNVDLLALSETWLGTTIDKLVTSELIPDGYDIHQVSRKDQRGGGLAVVDVKVVKNDCHSTHFELMECKIATKNQHLRLCVIYRPPPSKANKFRNSIFFEEWSRFLDRTVVVSEELIITGDLNFHLDDPTDNDAHKFLETCHWCTCDFTELNKRTRQIKIRYQDTQDIVEHLTTKYREIIKQLEKLSPHSKYTILEIPFFSIVEWNKIQKSKKKDQNYKLKDTEEKEQQDEDHTLEHQIIEVNKAIKNINLESQHHPSSLNSDLYRTSNRQARKYKGEGESSRHAGDVKSRRLYNISLLYDGIHPNDHLARAWLMKFTLQTIKDCWITEKQGEEKEKDLNNN